jgi:hypothetical protein
MTYDYKRGCAHAADLLGIKDGSLVGALYGTPDRSEVAKRLIVQAEQQAAEGICPEHQRGVVDTARRYLADRA